MIPHAVVFDLDKTLTRSKEPLTREMGELLAQLLERTNIAIASGGKLEQLVTQAANHLPASADLSRFFLIPTSGAAMYVYQDGWHAVYEEVIPEEEVPRVRKAMEEAIATTGVIDLTVPSFGERIEYRRSQVTLSALGQEAPIDLKEAWDPDRSKRAALREALAALLPEYDVHQGGSTTVDVTHPGISKAYGVRKLAAHLSIAIPDMLYIGDALFPGGNDEVVKETGIPTRATSGPEETAEIIKELLA